MGFADVFFMAVIVSGAIYLLYRSVWKKKGHCSGCETGCSAQVSSMRKIVQFNRRR